MLDSTEPAPGSKIEGKLSILKRRPVLHMGYSGLTSARILCGPADEAQNWNGPMGSVLEDVTSETIDVAHNGRDVGRRTR